MAKHVRGTGRVFQRKRSPFWWLSYYHRGKEIRESTEIPATEDNRARAEKMLREKLKTAGTHKHVTPTVRRVTFEKVARVYLNDYRQQGRRSLRDAERHVRQLSETFAGPWLDVTEDRIELYKTESLQAGDQPATIN